MTVAAGTCGGIVLNNGRQEASNRRGEPFRKSSANAWWLALTRSG